MATAMTQPSDGTRAATSARAETTETTVLSGCKPLFFLEKEVHSISQDEPYFSNVEVYKGISRVLDGSKILGIQQVRGMWRIYLSESTDRAKLLVAGFNLRNKHVSLRDVHPFRQIDGVRITIKDVPLSVDDIAIAEGLRCYGVKLLGPLRREKLRVDGRLTNCETGDRFGYMQEPATPADHIPRNVELVGRFRARVFYRDQTSDKNCSKCLGKGHLKRDCTSDWRCSLCNNLGHKRADCGEIIEATSQLQERADSCEDAGTEQEDRTITGQRQITDFTVVKERRRRGRGQRSEVQQSAIVTRSVVKNSRQRETRGSKKKATDRRRHPTHASRN
ncbi:hypothetical protein Bbelb_433080 [Branchiostoma belcheri]|nr:hypothetical protein Bbelb_433780 [Branchiostoma belcheri]KAI8478949.1 hypothetical protein Bbelb_433080 [Branchiostoma belcheri]